MRVRGRDRLEALTRRVQRWLDPQAVIVLYHRVAELPSDPWMLSVTPEHFAEQMDVLRRHTHVIRLTELTRALQKGRLPRRAVIVTFDDGYADNLVHAKPLLEKYDVPATVFVATGNVGRDREFWWDELDKLFLQPGNLPETLRLQIGGSTYEWELCGASAYTLADYDRHRSWRPWHKDTPCARQHVYHTLWSLMQPLSERERLQVRDTLLDWAGADPSSRPTHRTLSGAEVKSLAAGGLVEIGCHTVTHPMLSALPLSAQEEEIRQSKKALEDLLDRHVSSFAYPYGRACDYTDETVAIVREAGFAAACTTTEGMTGRGVDAYRLPRIQAQNVNGEVFARQIEEWFRR